MRRGIITSTTEMIRHGPEKVSFQPRLSPADINYYLLYWDVIAIAKANIEGFAIPHEKELTEEGILIRPKVRFTSWSTNERDGSYDPFVIAQSAIANHFIQDDSVDWVLHQFGNEIVIGNEQKKEFNSLRLDFVNLLPVPIEGIDPSRILKFKEKRKSEFEALHETMDELYLDILRSPDQDLSKRKSLSSFNNAITDLESSTKEEFKKSIKFDIRTELNVDPAGVVLGVAAGNAFDQYLSGTNIPIGTIFGGLKGLGLKIKLVNTFSVEKAASKMKLSYLVKASKEGIVQD